MNHADLGQLPRPLHDALLRALESLLDLHDTLLQVYPAQPTVPYPRSATEVLVLDALTQIAPLPATPKQVAEMIGKPHGEVQHILLSLEWLGTIYRLSKGNYSTVQPRLPHPARTAPDEAARPSAQYAARIARIVAQGSSRETDTAPTHDHPQEKGTAHD